MHETDPPVDAALVILDALSVASHFGEADYEATMMSNALKRLADIDSITVAIDVESGLAHVDASHLVAGTLMISDYLLERLAETTGTDREKLIHDARDYVSEADG